MASIRKSKGMFLKGGFKSNKRRRKAAGMSGQALPKIYPPGGGLPAIPEEKRIV